MRKLILVLVSVVACFFLIFNSAHIKSLKKITAKRINAYPIKIHEEEDEAREDGIAEAQKMEFELTKDVSLGYIPKDRLVKAYENLLTKKKFSPNTPISVSALTWTERGPNSDVVGPSDGNTRAGNGVTSGRMRAIWVDLSDATNHTVWAGGIDGGIWKTTNISASPASWVPVNDFFGNLAIGSICQDPLGTKDTMYFGTGEKTANADAVRGGGVWKSVDHGVTWNLLSSTTGFWNASKIVCDAAGNIYLSTIGNSKGIQRSTDGGSTWTNITPTGLNTSVTDMELSNTGRMHIVCGYRNGANAGYRFTDNPSTVTASTWTSATTVFPNVQYSCELAVNGNTLYVLNANSSYQTPQIYKSTDGGDNWTATSTSPPAAGGNNDLSSGQAWYNMALAVDPANDQNVIAGGLNCYRSTDGGATWTQISTWVGSSLTYIHADQQTAVWNGNQVLVGSDGGIFYSSDGGGTFTDRNVGLRLKQYYSCAMHPTSTNYFLAGAQDNGVDQLTNAGLGGATEVTGGDGAFVQIDQDEPQYQFGSYVYNQYKRSTDGGNTWSSVNYSNSIGQFINPTDYDNVNNKLYAGGGSNQYIRWENPQTGNTFTPITISAFSGAVRNVSISPYTSNRVFFGTSSGKIVKVDDANASSPNATDVTGVGMPSTNVSCVAVGTDDNNLIATYSNYGAVNHIWASTSGGGSGGWTNITGNFPDIPVRWAIFYPDDNTKAIIATEMGVYETSSINGSSTVWTQDPSFPIVRTDMLKYRKSDGTVAAATHGRGLWTANIPFTTPYIRFAAPLNDQVETTAATSGCRNYKDYTLSMNIDLPPTGNATVTLGIAVGGTATRGVDYDFTTNGDFTSPSSTLTFASGSSTPQFITLRIYDDAEVESRESFTLNYVVSGTTNAVAAPSSKTYTFYITDNDFAPVANGASNVFTIGTSAYYLTNGSGGEPFDAKLPSKRNQMLYRASELNAAGITAGTITSVAFNMTKASIRPYQNLQIKMGTTSVSNLVDDTAVNIISTSTVKTLASYSTVNGYNTFTLDVPFIWDGISNIAIEVCYDNGTGDTTDFADKTIGYNDGSTALQGNLLWQDSVNCSSSFTNVNYFGFGTKPQIQLGVTVFGNLIDTSGSRSEYIGSNGPFYFYNGNYILNSITTASANLGCVSSVLTGTGNTWQPFYGGMRSEKVFTISPTTNSGASYTIGLYFTIAELAGFDPATVQIAKTDAATIGAATAANTIIGSTTYVTYANGYLFTASFTGLSQFFLVNPGVVLPVTLLTFNGNLSNQAILLNWKTSSEHGSKYFDIEKSGNGTNFTTIGKVNAAGNSSSGRNYNYTDRQIDEYNYYRLKMADIDGKFTYSSTVLIKNLNVTQHLWVGNNPFRDIINIHLAKIPQRSIKVELMDESGARVYFKEVGSTNFLNVDVSKLNMASGVYILRTTVDGKIYTNKLLKL
ncbi:T9SS type A sorting domain-containing protein [Ginsengibacter hankyongi]|uniref:T9SS type A sorting domain-containing protein n=1 Tax=Ginsengibacter hankyongi TaxID=2607284 RepID=A0A5J5IH54_9BACT|nr:T9SS type A sorting domain-containing protein [Ginsengibacter hankyongi]KAA9039391.1 T9SS type A sorting domain-containing protein [Ginsengibacter hankyongi]